MLHFLKHGDLGLDLLRYGLHGKLAWHEPSLYVVVWYRFGRWIMSQRSPLVRLLLRALHTPVFALLTLLTGIHLPRHAKIGGGLRIWHFGCIVINPDAVIGGNCTLRHGVTIGTRREDHDVPILGDNVDIGAGAKLLGRIRVGDNVSVGANAVVLHDVPSGHIAVGVPARSLKRATVSPAAVAAPEAGPPSAGLMDTARAL